MADLIPGVWLGEWVLGERLGLGGFAQVFHGRCARDGETRSAAIKVGDLDHLRREAAAELSHPHVLPVLERHLDHDPPFLVLELAAGGSLRDELAAGPCDPARAWSVIQALASALDHAHARGVLHLDLKPENVLLDASGRPLLCDFGATNALDAEALRHSAALSSSAVSTPAYAAPELASGEPVDRRADVYGLGVLAFELLTGHPPVGLDRPSALVGVPPAVDEVLEGALARDPHRRPLCAGDLAAALRRALETPPPAESPTLPPRRTRLGLATTALLCSLAGVGLHALQRARPEPADSPLARRVAHLVGPRPGRVSVLLSEDLGHRDSPRAQGLSDSLAAALGERFGAQLSTTGVDVFERPQRDRLARAGRAPWALQAVLPADAQSPETDCVLLLIELGPLQVVAADAPRPGAADGLARALLAKLDPDTRGALAVLPARELPAGNANATTAAFDVALLSSLARHAPPELAVRANTGLRERLKAWRGDLRHALATSLVLEVTLNDVAHEARAVLRDMEGPRQLAQASVSWEPPAGHDPQRGSVRFALEWGAGTPEAAGLLARAQAQLDGGEPRGALETLAPLLRAPADLDPQAWVLASRARRALDEPWLAVELARRALELNPHLPAAHSELAQGALQESDRLYAQGKGAWWRDDDERAFQAALTLLDTLDQRVLPPELREQVHARLALLQGEL